MLSFSPSLNVSSRGAACIGTSGAGVISSGIPPISIDDPGGGSGAPKPLGGGNGAGGNGAGANGAGGWNCVGGAGGGGVVGVGSAEGGVHHGRYG